jgi:UDP-glucose 4-epimerase
MKKIAVTGSAGFIGRKLIPQLRDLDIEVIELDLVNFSNSKSYVNLDLLYSDVEDIIVRLKPEVVIHLAAQTEVLKSFEDPENDFLINALGTLKLVRSAAQSGTQHFIYINSGGAIYSKDAKLPILEDSITKPESPYGISKMIGESYLEVLSEKHGMQWTSLALSNCYGSVSENKKGVIYEFWKAISSGLIPHINGEEVTRDFIHVNDVVKAIVLTVDHPLNCRINISSGVEVNLRDIYQVVAHSMDSKVSPELRPHIKGEVLRSALDNSRAYKLLGWRPEIKLVDGITLSLKQDRESN